MTAVHAFPNDQRIPLRDLPVDEYLNVCLAMRECPERVQWYFAGWANGSYPIINSDAVYRVLPLVREAVIPWEHIVAEFRWYAEDNTSGPRLYERKPRFNGVYWSDVRGNCLRAKWFAAFVPSEGIAPEDSLQERPS